MEQAFVILAVLGACAAVRVPHRSDTATIEVAYQQPITMDRFEAMLERASHILRSPPQVVEPQQDDSNNHYQQGHREDHQNSNYYVPLFQSERNEKLDAKSRQMQYMMPPPEDNLAANFYAIKQKKLPKKFMNAEKHINVKVTGDDSARSEVPLQTRGYSKENNIVFDDVIYGVNAQAAVPEDIPQEHSTDHGIIAPIYSRRLPKSEDMFATSALNRESRMKGGFPITRFAIMRY